MLIQTHPAPLRYKISDFFSSLLGGASMKNIKWLTFLFVVSGLALLPSVAKADAFDVQVGYADNLRPSPFFPSNFCNGGTQFDGSSGATCTQTFDAGAIRIINTTGAAMIVSDVNVQINSGTNFDLWNTSGNFTIANSTDEVLSQTNEFNFDSSDFGTSVAPGDGFLPIVKMTFSVDGGGTFQTESFTDSGQVLNTGGFDTLNGFNGSCIGGNNVAGGNVPGNCNESLQWRDIGTSGFTNPGGTVPEPASGTLLIAGLGGLAGLALKKSI
jgi:hypothetical protein